MVEFLIVGMGGFIGSCARFGLAKLTIHFGTSFPYGTFISNVLAGFLIGFIIGIEQQSIIIMPKSKLFLTTGLLGGLSTFSTFSLETVNLFSSGKYLVAAANVLLNLGLSLFGVVFGMFLARILFKKI